MPRGRKAAIDYEKIYPDQAFWVVTTNQYISVRINKDSLENPLGPEIMLAVRGPSRAPTIFLSDCTVTELEEIKKVIDRAFELAKPVCETRDRIAREAFDDGDDSFNRIYRGVPNVVTRPWAQSINSKSIRERLDGSSYPLPEREL